MAFLHSAFQHDPVLRNDPGIKWGSNKTYSILKAPEPPPTPGVPSWNDAANAAQAQTDAMRMRRGMLANIYGGGQAQQPVTGKVSLGT